MVETSRGQFHVLDYGTPDGIPVLFVHGNVSSSTFWEEMLLALPEGFRGIAPDLRGYGESETLPVDATRGLRDFSDDLYSLVQTLALETVCLVGHSFGGGVTMQYTIDYPQTVRSLTLVAPASPFGYGGTKDVQGTPCWQDYAGSGGGIVNPEIIRRLQAGDRSEESDFSPRQLLRKRYVAPPYRSPRENVLVEAMLMISTDDGNYSRDMVVSANWPFVAPGTRGANNALSPKYCNLSPLADISPRPPIIWIRGTADQIVADGGLGDPGTLGSLGFLPGWPGMEVYPPQPMVSQTRSMLERYRANGGKVDECVIEKVGHVPYMEEPDVFLAMWLPFLQAV
jgi:pimeloyl-ACP methyl ester carboxylesterase